MRREQLEESIESAKRDIEDRNVHKGNFERLLEKSRSREIIPRETAAPLSEMTGTQRTLTGGPYTPLASNVSGSELASGGGPFNAPIAQSKCGGTFPLGISSEMLHAA